jgi:hypothetical protein
MKTEQNTLPGTEVGIDEIVSSLVKVKLTIGCSGGKVRVNELSKETAQAHGASERDISTSVKWMAKESRALLGGVNSRLRTAFNNRTLPWEDGGYRVVPAAQYSALCDAVAEAGDAFRKVGQDIADGWDDILAEAKKRLNGAFGKLDIPSRDEFIRAQHYGMVSDVVTATADIRIEGLGEATVERIRRQAEANYVERIENAVAGMLADLTNLLTDLVARCDKDKQKGTRYEGWAGWAKRTVKFMRPLNLTNDYRLTQMLDRVQALADEVGKDADSVREDDKARRNVQRKAVDVLDLFGIK